ncbi:hypothetical protein DS745_24110 [Anaerobacillus alkaliphilus]|uniref:Uncharacterized protein n=1 Tax=Anaerobacillus alkaliphilus TaxID=1548597 RepID=A0A4Q0VKP0_9BACI|nr:hypothetical protein [Anaerobacillus alkaliphilus]RXI95540.1 hypothetical protein DS745_24110 [Anaerobacillus alkaliphilus]
MSELTNVQKKPFVKHPDGMFLFQIGKTDWKLDVKRVGKKRSLLDRMIGFNPNEPIKRTSYFDIVAEEENYYHCVIGFRDKVSGEFTYTRIRKGSDCIINEGIMLVSPAAFLEGSNPSEEESFILAVVEESALHQGSQLLSEDLVPRGELKNRYKISLSRNRQLIVNGYHYAFIASGFVLLHLFDGYEEFLDSSDGIDLDLGGIF